MKTKIKSATAIHRTQLFTKHIVMCALLALTVPPTLLAQQIVFYDTFGTSSLEQTNIAGGIPGGLPTDSQTSYTIASAKNALGTTIGAGHLQLITSATSSGSTEAQALFTKYPVTLASVGDYVEVTYTFTDTYKVLQSDSSGNSALFVGIYDSGGVAPQYGEVLANGGLSTSKTDGSIGGTMNWVGYHAQMYNFSQNWRLYTRVMQTAQNNANQTLLYNEPQGGANGGSISPGTPSLIIGQQYTVQLRVTLSDVGQLTVSNALYTGADTSGPQFTNTSWTVTGANVLSTNFDALAIGYRATDSYIWTNDINSIKVVAGLAAQAGPYFSVTSSGDPCSGGLTVGLSGSVTTNAYLLYINGVDSGQSVAGTGSAIDFGFQNVSGTYTVIASNTVTASEGPMYGSATIASGPPVINTQPTSVTVVTNVSASFSVDATGTTLTYQWYKNGVALTNGGDISGAQTTNLVIYPTQAADAATVANGYYVVAQDPCGNVVTSTPNASLTLTPPRNLVWVGGNPDNNWEYTETNFTVSGTPTTFMDGDNVTFDDTSANKTVTITTNLVPTSVTVNSASGYTFNGTGKLTGFGKLVDVGSGNVTIVNDFASKYDYTGGTIVSNGATLTFGDGASINGSVGGIVTVSSGGTLNYNYAGSGTANSPVNLNNGLASSGTVNYNDVNGSILATPLEIISSNFNGTINIQGFTALHASDNNAGYALGDGSTVNVPPNTQVWLDRSATAYNNTFNIAGTGWLGATPGTGAMRVYNCTINGPINLMDNARIGGSINGATIQSVISGDYQLEIYGNTNSFVLVMGPTNGSPQAYTSTLITSGAIRAVNTNAISTGPLTIDQGGDMQLYGNDITVANLSSIDSGVNTVIEGPRVRNMSATTAATLTVGTDGANSEFDGTFSDGAAAPLGVTKVGAGTLTLTGVNTNTGAVTVSGGTIAMSGSGSFNTASAIAIGSGAFYDVSGAGGTLTLNTSQTLQGNGTLAGTLDASAAGSTVAPGLPMGTLTVSGNATISGAYRANLNRTNSPSNCSKLTSSGGTVTYSGAALSVTNVGPKLQAGDVFQLFSGATSGFSAFNLQTNDPVNNAVYTWDNTITSDGRITVAGVSTLVNTNPTNIVATVSGGSLTLTWPMDHTGWTLQVQTNSLNVGLSTNWVNVPGSSLINSVTNAINQTNGSVFYRLIYNP